MESYNIKQVISIFELNRKEVLSIIQSILVIHFKVVARPTFWETILVALNANFKVLGFLIELEQLTQMRLIKRNLNY